jgi:sugar phosphate isomerase/epimerase
MKMRLSHFGYLKDLEDIAAAGYDCAELHIREIMGLDDVEYKAALKKVKDLALPCEVYDNPIPLDVVIADPAFDMVHWKEFLKKGAYRTSEMGARYYVFGNGRTRRLPVEGDVKRAHDQLMEFMDIMCDIAAEHNITVLLEPLGPSFSNFINSIPEAVDFIDSFGKHNLKTFCDLRHLIAINGDLEDIVKYEKYIKHIHIDYPYSNFPERFIPSLEDGFDYAPFLDVLKKICYKEIISIEASTFKNFKEDIAGGIQFFKAHDIHSYRG